MSFRRVSEATAADWDAVRAGQADHAEREYRECLRLLDALADIRDGFEVDQLTHSLIAASMAERAGAPEWLVLVALLHDVGKPLSLVHHGEVAAAMFRGRLSENACEVLRRHGEFMADAVHGTDGAARYLGEPWYLASAHLAAWDAESFDPDYPTLPLGYFQPMLRSLYGLGPVSP